MIHIPSISENREVPHFAHAIGLFFQKITVLIMDRYSLYLLFRTKTIHEHRQHNESQLIIRFVLNTLEPAAIA